MNNKIYIGSIIAVLLMLSMSSMSSMSTTATISKKDIEDENITVENNNHKTLYGFKDEFYYAKVGKSMYGADYCEIKYFRWVRKYDDGTRLESRFGRHANYIKNDVILPSNFKTLLAQGRTYFPVIFGEHHY